MSKKIVIPTVFILFFAPTFVGVTAAIVFVLVIIRKDTKAKAAILPVELPVIVDTFWNVLYERNPVNGEAFTQASAEEFLASHTPLNTAWFITSREAMARQTAAQEALAAQSAPVPAAEDTEVLPAVSA